MSVLIAFECSGVVRRAFAERGHEVWSCDLQPAEDESPRHIVGDAIDVIASRPWELVIAHPPCTFLCLSGVRWLYDGQGREPDRWRRMTEAAELFNRVLRSPVPRLAVENSQMHPHALALIDRPADDVVQPHYFGDTHSKALHLWLKGLPPLLSTCLVAQLDRLQYSHSLPPGPDRARLRSRTRPLVAEAFAEQWGRFL